MPDPCLTIQRVLRFHPSGQWSVWHTVSEADVRVSTHLTGLNLKSLESHPKIRYQPGLSPGTTGPRQQDVIFEAMVQPFTAKSASGSLAWQNTFRLRVTLGAQPELQFHQTSYLKGIGGWFQSWDDVCWPADEKTSYRWSGDSWEFMRWPEEKWVDGKLVSWPVGRK